MSLTVPYSPLDALINALPELKRAGRVKTGDTVSTVHQRYVDILRPIVERIETEATTRTIAAIQRMEHG